ncbi:MAG: response regulator [Chloroflexi bacterium]|nr:response regulator [Chloroflexota bacterium]
MLRNLYQRFKRIGLQRRIMIYVTLGLVIFTALFAWVAQQAVQQSTEFVYHERLLVARTIARQMDNPPAHMQEEIEETALLIPSMFSVSDSADTAHMLRALRDHWLQLHSSETLGTIILTDAQRKIVWIEPRRDDLLGAYLTQFQPPEPNHQASSLTVSNGAVLEPLTSTAIVYTVPIHTDTYSGFLVGLVEQSYLASELQSALALNEVGYQLELIDRAGLVVASYPVSKKALGSPHLVLVEELWQKNEAGVRMHNSANGGHVIAFAPLAQLPWGVVVEQNMDAALLLPRAVQTWFIGGGLFALLGGLVLAWITTRRVVHPVNALIHASQQIAHGDLDYQINISGEGEVGVLARSFNDMRLELKQSRQEIARWNEELEARVEQRTRELTALVESSQALTATLNLDALFRILMHKTHQVFPAAESAALFLFERESETLTVRASFGLDISACAQIRFRRGEGIAGHVFEADMYALLPTCEEVRASQLNLSVSNRLHFRRAIGEREIQSALGVPLEAKGARLGALMLYNFTRETTFSENDVPLLQGLANQAAAANGREAIRLARELQPTVMVMDLTMPELDGLEATRVIKQSQPRIQLLALTMHESDEYFFRVLQAGASGYVLKRAAASDLIAAVRAVARGEVFLYPAVAKKLVADYLDRAHLSGEQAAQDTYLGLTPREREILTLIAEGLSNREIADRLVLSLSTVQTHYAHIMEKLNLHNRAELIKYAIRRGLIEVET